MREYICPVCGKRFIQNAPSQYIYKDKHDKLLCSYTCYRIATKDDYKISTVRGYRLK